LVEETTHFGLRGVSLEYFVSQHLLILDVYWLVMGLTIIEDPTQELSHMVSEGVERRHLSVSPEAQAYVVGVLVSLTLADDIFTAREKPSVDGDTGRYIKPFTFQLQEAADRPYLFKGVGDRCLFVLGFAYDAIRMTGAPQVKFHSAVGRTAYGRYAHVVAQYQDHLVHSGRADPLFTELADSFDGLAAVVGDLHLKRLDDDQVLLDYYNRFRDTGDQRYAGLLKAKGIPLDVLGSSS